MSQIFILAPSAPLVLMLALCALAFILLVGWPLIAALARIVVSAVIIAMIALPAAAATGGDLLTTLTPSRDPLAAMVKVDTSGTYDPEAERLDRRRKFFRMWEEIPSFAQPVVKHVVLDDQSLRSMPERLNGRHEARQLDRLQRGLDALHKAWS
ncbi:hypothetical protein [Cereibacter johrii]|uniref:hypothetical protein n=1 Tax=Cereibacter johrii TaxID=445629 RepID=UPI000DCD1AB9|nr:hypothetical protein [Cereibacter johrii]RAZ82410.1 hypothetical protein DDV93_19300 [Cereibacter johrii]